MSTAKATGAKAGDAAKGNTSAKAQMGSKANTNIKTRTKTGAQAGRDNQSAAPSKAPQSAATPSPFPPIADYAFLSNCHTGALIAPDGSVDWLCVPRFDAPSVFGTLLDRQAGAFRFAPFGINVPTARIYEPGTNTVATTWTTPTGWLLVRDALTLGPRRGVDLVTPHTRPPTDEDADHVLVRVALCLGGEVDIELTCEPVFDYGRTPAEWSIADEGHRADASGEGLTLRLQTDMAVGVEGDWVRARHVLRQGEQVYCSLSWAEELDSPLHVDEANERLAATAHFWRTWLDRARLPDHRWREPIQRSALAIKGLTYMPTGATVAALTTSLPETPGGERNWDYRYTWLRDSTFTLQALHFLNLDWEAEEFMQFVADLEPNGDGALQIMYAIDGRRDLTESTREDLSGYAGASPVRVGNGAFDQRQNDVYGATLDSILLHTRRSERLPRRLWPIVQAQAKCAAEVWGEPDQGIWEARGAPQHYVSSKLMCWVAMDRAAKLAAMRGDSKLQESWQATAEEIKADVLAHGMSDQGVLRQHYDTDALDASTLLAALFGFLPAGDERLCASVLAIADDLTEDGFVLRYRTGETDDGMSGKEGSFLICSFWLVSALAIVGEEQRARDLMEKLLSVASPLGLYAEEFDTSTGRHLGNFPQAFSHLALIEAAARIILAERIAELA
jgi:GH15 family glucan-1,4-alpha-glucosidase